MRAVAAALATLTWRAASRGLPAAPLAPAAARAADAIRMSMAPSFPCPAPPAGAAGAHRTRHRHWRRRHHREQHLHVRRALEGPGAGSRPVLAAAEGQALGDDGLHRGHLTLGPQAVLVSNATGAPQITPQQLLDQALGELRVPKPWAGQAPPRGTDGLVGLPEWFWIPAGEWARARSRSRPARCGRP